MRFPTLLLLSVGIALPAQDPAPLRIVATTPDLGALAHEIGGADVTITVLVPGPGDPHFVEARPSMIRALHDADVLIEVGLELEIGWLPLLVANARNAAVLPGGGGRIDASAVVDKLGVPTGGVDRSLGDVHAGGNPHFLSDPVAGLRVAALLRDRFAEVRPAAKERFAAAFASFRERLATAMFGAEVAKLYGADVEKLGELFARGKLTALLEAQGDAGKLGGWCGAMAAHRGAQVVADHDLWPYFARRFGIEVIGFFEPKPGIAPSTAHLEKLIARMRAEHVTAILTAPYFAPQHARLVAEAAGAHLAPLAHQVGALPGCDDYLAWLGHNVTAVVAALSAKS